MYRVAIFEVKSVLLEGEKIKCRNVGMPKDIWCARYALPTIRC